MGIYKRVSLETRNRYIAQELYNAYLLDKVKNKINGSQSQINKQAHHSNQEI